MASYHPYNGKEMNKCGLMVPCASDPCKMHGDSDIQADSAEQAQRIYNARLRAAAKAQDENERRVDNVCNEISMSIARDVDVADSAGIVCKKMNALLDGATVSEGETDVRTRKVLTDAVRFRDNIPGGSRSDYIASHVDDTLQWHRVELADDFNYAGVVDSIKRNALNPNRELRDYAYPEDSDRWIVSDDAEVNPNAGMKPVKANAVIHSPTGDFGVVPTRTPSGNLTLCGVSDDGTLDDDVNVDIDDINKRGEILNRDNPMWGLSKPLTPRETSVYVRDYEHSGIRFDKDVAKVTGSYTLHTPFGVQRFYRLTFTEDMESLATQNAGFSGDADVLK